MAKGLFLIGREMFDHPIVGMKKPAWAIAWIWMIGAANWKQSEVEILGDLISLERGQFSHSYRFMAKRFGMSVKGIRVFLGKLEKHGMIKITKSREKKGPKKGTQEGTQKTNAQNIITICNYEDYQDFDLYKEQIGASEGQARGKRGAQRRTPDITPDEQSSIFSENLAFETWYSECPKKTGKEDAEKAYNQCIKAKKSTHEVLLNAIIRYANEVKENDTERKWIKGPGAWIRAGRYNDEAAPPSNGNNGKGNKPGNGQQGNKSFGQYAREIGAAMDSRQHQSTPTGGLFDEGGLGEGEGLVVDHDDPSLG